MNMQEKADAYVPQLQKLLEMRNSYICEELTKWGWDLCPTQGYNSSTYISPCGGFVLRVSKRAKDAYVFHAEAAMENDNPFFQRVYFHQRIGDGQSNLTLMEKLEPVSKAEVMDIPEASVLIREFTFGMPFHGREFNPVFYGKKVEGESFHAFLEIIKQLLVKNNLFSDVKSDNFMKRADGQLVLIDSVC